MTLATSLLVLALVPAAAHAAGGAWGEFVSGSFSLPEGSEPGQIHDFESRFAAAPDGEYFIVEHQKGTGGEPPDFRLQHFAGKEVKGTVSFSRKQEVKETGVKGEPTVEVESSGPDLLAIDPARHRVYVLETFLRREADKEEVEKNHFPLDDSQPAAGALYGFEYTATEVKAINGGKALLDAEQLAFQGEKAGEALLNPRGMAVDPRSGDVAIVSSEDIQENKVVEKGKGEKECRPVAQYFVPEASGGKLGHRFADTAGVMLKKEPEEEEEEEPEAEGCGAKEGGTGQVHNPYLQTPLSPVITAQGRLLAYSDLIAVHEEGQIWEIPGPAGGAPSTTEIESPGTTTVTPDKLYDEEKYSAEEFAQAGEAVGLSEMSLVGQGSGEGTLYVNAIYRHFSGSSGAPILLHLSEPAKPTEPAKLTEVGLTAGAEVVTGEVAPACGILDQETSLAQIAGLEGNKYIAFSQYQTKNGHSVEVKEFGEGGDTTGCPTEPALTPAVSSAEGAGVRLVPVGEQVTLEDAIATLELGTPKYAGLARSVEWVIKYRLADGDEGEEKIPVAYPEPESPEVELKHTFKAVGRYEVSTVITTNDLGNPIAQASAADVIEVVASPLTSSMNKPEPDEIPADEGAVKLSVKVEPPPGKKVLITNVKWSFGDGSAPEEQHPERTIEAQTTFEANHEFSRCASGSCRVEVVIEGHEADGASYSGEARASVTVIESAKEKAAREAAEKAQKEAAEQKQHEEEARQAEQKKHEEEAQQQAEQKKHEEEARQQAEQKKHEEEQHAKGAIHAYMASVAHGPFSVSAGVVSIRVSCPSGGSCSGTITLQITRFNKHRKKILETIASGSFSLTGGSTKALTLHLSATVQAQLKHSRQLSARLTETSSGQSTIHENIALKPAAHTKHR